MRARIGGADGPQLLDLSPLDADELEDRGLISPNPPTPPTPPTNLAAAPTPPKPPHDPFMGVGATHYDRQSATSMAASGRRATNKMNARRVKMIQLVRGGMKIGDALKELGAARNTYVTWRRSSPKFASDIDEARLRSQLGPNATTVGGSSAISFRRFRLEHFGMTTAVHQDQLVKALDMVKPREIGLVLIHPEAGKTTTLEDYICKRLAENPNLRIVHLSEAGGLARKVLARIKNRMTDIAHFESYINEYGPFYMDNQEREGKPWAADYIKVWQAGSDGTAERDYSLEARAVTSSAYGSRIDLLIGDDVQSRKTWGQTAAILGHLRQTYFTRGRRMAIIFIGTRIGPGDVYEAMIDEELVDWVIEIPAMDPMGEPTCPEWWVDDPEEFGDTVEGRQELAEEAKLALAKIRKQVGEEVWWASYMQTPQVAGTATFPREILDLCDDPTRVYATAVQQPDLYREASLDPALGGGNALLVCEHTPTNLVPIDLDYQFHLARVEQILTIVENMAIRYKFTALAVEQAAFQKALANDQRLRDLASKYGFVIYPHDTNSNKRDPVMGVAAMAGSFIRREILLPSGDTVIEARLAPLRAQLLAWRPTIPTKLLKQDAVMALWFQWMRWMRLRREHEQENKTWEIRARLPWSPLRAPLSRRSQ